MISLSKENIASRLRDYANIRGIMIDNPDITQYTALRQWTILLDGTKHGENIEAKYLTTEYFANVHRTVSMYHLLKFFSLIEESSYEYILESELDFDLNKIFNDKVPNNLSKKKLILLLRNAFNHNDDPQHSKYNISINGKYLELDLLDIRKESEKKANPNDPIPLNFKINYEQLSEIVSAVTKANKGLIMQEWTCPKNFRLEKMNEGTLKKIKTTIHYLKRKISDDSRPNIHNFSINGVSEETAHNFLDTQQNEKNQSVEHYLYPEQVKYVIEVMNSQTLISLLAELSDTFKTYLFQELLKDTEPLPMYKIEQFRFLGLLEQLFLINPNISQKDIIKTLLSCAENENTENETTRIIKEVYLRTPRTTLDLYKKTLDVDMQAMYPFMEYWGYMLDTIIDDEYIEINGKIYERIHLRDSVVHGRYILGNNNTIHFYDRNNGFAQDNNIHTHYEINYHDLKNYIEDQYIIRIKKEDPAKYKRI